MQASSSSPPGPLGSPRARIKGGGGQTIHAPLHRDGLAARRPARARRWTRRAAAAGGSSRRGGPARASTDSR